jgi:hypothetical protein
LSKKDESKARAPKFNMSVKKKKIAGSMAKLLKKAVGTRVLHDQSGSAKKGRPKSARGEGPELANDRLWHSSDFISRVV